MPLTKSLSNPTLNEGAEEPPSGPLSGPSTVEWRRQRLLRIGSQTTPLAEGERDEGEPGEPGESSSLRPDHPARAASYGTLPSRARANGSKHTATFRSRHALGALPSLLIPKSSRYATPPTPSLNSPRSLRNSSYFASQRPISAYDRPVVRGQDDPDQQGAVKTNGVRVWYSSFTSIDWLHDAIKDSARQSALRKRRSKRGRARRQIDRAVGWITVTIIGFLTAVVAFLIVRGEQWLFDVKEGYCTTGFWRAKRFCCPIQDDDVRALTSVVPSFLTLAVEEDCPAWRSWGQYFRPIADSADWLETEVIEYFTYTVIAVRTMFSVHYILSMPMHNHRFPWQSSHLSLLST